MSYKLPICASFKENGSGFCHECGNTLAEHESLIAGKMSDKAKFEMLLNCLKNVKACLSLWIKDEDTLGKFNLKIIGETIEKAESE